MSGSSGIHPLSLSPGQAASHEDVKGNNVRGRALYRTSDTVEFRDGGAGSAGSTVGCCLCVALYFLCSCIRSCFRALFCCCDEADPVAPATVQMDKEAATELLKQAYGFLNKTLVFVSHCKLVVRFSHGIETGTAKTYDVKNLNAKDYEDNVQRITKNEMDGMVCVVIYENKSSSPEQRSKGLYVAQVAGLNGAQKVGKTYCGNPEKLLEEFNKDPFLESFKFDTEELSLPTSEV